MLLKVVAGLIMEHLVTHNSHGYSQISRQGEGGYCNIPINGKIYKVKEGDRDCSSAIINAYESAGISCGGASYTGNMKRCMTTIGNFKWHPISEHYTPKYGDIYLSEKDHTVMYVGNNKIAEFRISETGKIDGKEGDQTGRESLIRNYYNYHWDGILECISNETDGIVLKPIDEIADEVIRGGIWGSGQERKRKLEAAGYNYRQVQDRVNEKLKNPAPKKTIDELADEVIRGGIWGSGEERKKRLEAAGYNYREVQDRVNEKLAHKKSIDEIADEVIRGGIWGSGEERKKRLEAAGYNYRQVQDRVNEKLKNR